jgi:CRP-like cAMP-binding protein
MSEREFAAWAEPTAVVRALPFMAVLPPAVRNLVLAGFEERTYRFGETVVTPEDGAFVVVVEGEVRAITDGPDGSEVSLGLLGPGETSGERALVEEHPPAVTLRAASSAVRVLRLERAVALALARAHPEAAAGFSAQARAKRIGAFLRLDATFAQLDPNGLELLVTRGRDIDAHAGDVVVREGERTDHWWIVQSGRLVEHSGEGPARREVRFLRAGDVFGEIGALRGSLRLATVTAASDCTLLELDGAVLGELGALDHAFAARLEERAQLHLSRIAVRPLDFGGGDVLSAIRQRPPPRATFGGRPYCGRSTGGRRTGSGRAVGSAAPLSVRAPDRFRRLRRGGAGDGLPRVWPPGVTDVHPARRGHRTGRHEPTRDHAGC